MPKTGLNENIAALYGGDCLAVTTGTASSHWRFFPDIEPTG